MKKSFNQTIYASYIGYITQAIINNFAPLLFVTFNTKLGISMDKIALLISINFGTQLMVDYLAARFVKWFGTRFAIVSAHFFAASGLVMMAFLPYAIGFAGLVISTVCYAIGGGLIEVLVSPVVEACPTEKKSAAMSLLHSFYCWGQLFTIVVSTLFFTVFGIKFWHILSCIWAVIPFLNAFWFMTVPINSITEDKSHAPRRMLFSSKLFWVLLLLMLCSGASELAMSQWASVFAEDALGVTKTIGDLSGPCMFALLMGISRVLYAKISDNVSIERFMIFSCILCIISYLTSAISPNPVIALIGCGVCGFSVGIMWPGTYSIAAKRMPAGGVPLFSSLALAGDLGCSTGPALVGIFAADTGLKAGILAGTLFPAIMLIGILLLKHTTNCS